MATRDRSDPSRRDGYFYAAQRPVNSLVFVLPLLAFFHLGAVVYGSDLLAPMLVRRFLEFFGATAAFLPPLLVLAILLLQQAARREGWKVQPLALGGMLAESALYTLPLIALSYFTGRMIVTGGGGPAARGQQVVLKELFQAVGAGIYEEFLFRLLLVGLGLLVLVDILELNKEAAGSCVVLGAGLLFSLAHFRLAGAGAARPFDWNPFLFLTAAGSFWGVLYVKRGFGIAVGSHILWDVYVVLAGA